MADKPFRILLDVTDLYLENFKYVWVNISPRELKTIFDLKKCALRKINLEQEDVELFVRDGLLLDEETIVVLREDDTVKIKYKNPYFSRRESLKESANFSRKRSLAESNDNDENTNSKRYKPEILALSSTRTENNGDGMSSKKGKRKNQTESPISFENCHFTLVGKEKAISVNSDKSSSTLKEKQKKHIQTESLVNFENCHSAVTEKNNFMKKKHKKKNKKESSITLDETTIDVNFCNKTDSFDSIKCAPQKQNKSNISSEIELQESENMEILNNYSLSNKFTLDMNESAEIAVTDINSTGFDNEKKSVKRRRKRRRKCKQSTTFNISDSCDVIDNSKSSPGNADDSIRKSQDKNCSDDANKFQNHFTDTVIQNEDESNDIQKTDAPKMSTPAQPDNYTIPDWQLSLMPCKDTNLSFVEDDSELHKKLTRKNSTVQSRGKKSDEQLYKDFPDLTSLPIVGTRVAYKALELDENYTPIATDYREGVVEKVNPKTEEIEIQLKKEIILPARTGRFENLGKDEIPEPTIKKYDVLKWCNMISPKILSYLPE